MEAKTKRHGPSVVLVLAAFAVVYVVWGSTYLAIRFALDSLPPFLMAAMRFLVAGAVLYPLIRHRSDTPPTAANWLAAAIVGCLMLVGGNGLVCWAEQTVPSGLAALIIATVPLWFVTLDWLMFGGPRPTGTAVVGLVAGLVGILVLIGPSNLGGDAVDLFGGLALLVACVFWSFGSLYSRRAGLPGSTLLSTSMQMLAAGVAFVLLGTVTGEWSRVHIEQVSAKSLLSLAYLIVFGSILALTCYGWLLKVSTPARVSTYAYVNPIIAVVLGAALANEPLNARVLLAAAIILTSVVMITASPRNVPGNARTSPVSRARTRSVAVSPVRGRPCFETPRGEREGTD